MTLFDVYECAISARVLEKKIRQAEEKILGKSFLAVSREAFQSFAKELTEAGFEADESGQLYRVLDSPAARAALQKVGLEVTVQARMRPRRRGRRSEGTLGSRQALVLRRLVKHR